MSPVDRRRADSFGAEAELYDQVRPSYPPEMIDVLLAGDPARGEPGPLRILDVGCGTGKAARLLVGPERDVVGLEPDPRMAAVARRHGLTVEIGRFETWDPGGRHFDLVTSGQAWHWVDPVIGARKAAAVLRDGGRFAAFWNQMRHSPDVIAVCDSVYGRHAPQLRTTTVVLGSVATLDACVGSAAAALTDAGFRVTERTGDEGFAWRIDHTPEGWIRLLGTHSDHATLEPAVREALFDDLRDGLERLGPSFVVELQTDLLMGTRP